MADDKKKDGKRKVPKGRHLSAMKRGRQNVKRRERNLTVRSSMRTASKRVLEAVQKKDLKSAAEVLKSAMSRIHKAAKAGIVHRRNASRRIARLSAMVSKASQPAKTAA
jgi:small subunit ribosomal protein S20